MKTRLRLAFAKLERLGFVAEKHFGCCQSCANKAIFDRIETQIDLGSPPPLGIVFYHAQDAEDLDDGKDFYLSFCFGDVHNEERPISAVAVGRIIVAILYLYGIETTASRPTGTEMSPREFGSKTRQQQKAA